MNDASLSTTTLRDAILDAARDIKRLLTSGATFDGVRLQPRDARSSEDPCQRGDRGHRIQTHRVHLVVHADRSVVQPGSLQRRTYLDRLFHNHVSQLRRARPRAPGPGLEHRRRSVDLRAPA